MASRILSNLDDDEIERLTLELSSLGTVESGTREAIIEEFHQMFVANRYASAGASRTRASCSNRPSGQTRRWTC